MESERSSRQKAEKDLLEMEKLIGSLRVDVSQYEQRAAAVTQELAAETDKVRCEDAQLCCCCCCSCCFYVGLGSSIAALKIRNFDLSS